MNFRFKNMLLACVFAVPSVLTASIPAHAQEPVRLADDVKVQVNKKLVAFPDAQPFVDENHKLQVPARAVTDKLGYKLQWEQDGSRFTITIQSSDKTVSLSTGDRSMTVNGKPTQITDPAKFVDGRVYVPFRLISDTFGIKTQWDKINRIAILSTDGQYHAPAWYRPVNKVSKVPNYSKVIVAKATAYTASADENGGYAGLDYMGNPLRLGTIAVDPSVIPLGSKVYVEGYTYDGLPAGGMYATATDTGGAVKGNRIDIFLPESKNKARMFGIQQVKVYILGS
ncbi:MULTISPECIES: stalk domain-containing protein [Paenibacillus]|uniref:3D domain-containing protein n=1 Tax=Paenibacillus naphthalenovorans TaxID=162209 RepID=A0A0U2WG09_9BACL|nr:MULTISPECIES: stalk domain-containing protein [Paenibacillus]ALS25310.1 3D domain-containing protein [Paenibacillus naphthalenovorans]NTZ20218.1 hypothetical protein [Paenibacillus sp. JMULE4]GCL74737.1 hypothetical protein PN4B1_47190 [Paenibacillus naphthalenovorans]SDJ64429.1 3D (Asp-Asp-Asp) domain-containing protein [Paenibacillus naphthalenovorans]